jgi:hypothetical protein
MSEEEFHCYVSDVLARHGITKYTMVLPFHFVVTITIRMSLTHCQNHNTPETMSLMKRFVEVSGLPQPIAYDMITQIEFPDIQCFVNFTEDPFYKEHILPDHGNF